MYGSFEEARVAHTLGHLELHAKIRVRDKRTDGEFIDTTVGRIIFDEIVPRELPFYNEVTDKKVLKDLVSRCFNELGNEATAKMADAIKDLGFRYGTQSGITIAVDELRIPEEKQQLLTRADAEVEEIRSQYQMGLMTDDERYMQTVKIWTEATDAVAGAISDHMGEYGSINLMSSSGAKGNIAQIRQMAGMRGLMSDPSGRIIELPIRSSFREGLSVLEYFISTHGARKGLADTALRTADSGYLTRRLIDVAQDVLIREEDCAIDKPAPPGLVFEEEPRELGLIESLRGRVMGRYLAAPVADGESGEILADVGQLLDEELVDDLMERGISLFRVRSPMLCTTRNGLCKKCYGRSMATGSPASLGEAVGIKDLSLSTAGAGDDSQVTVSGYIAPGLQVKYGVGLFNDVNEFR